MDQTGLADIPLSIQLAGVALEVNLRITKAHKQEIHPGFETRSPKPAY